ncbi:MAG: polynucleotide adenylyltransferase PcnB, partial [Proteobacteria bacterium]|nr:polynucleotide adenylyltransferase PcnB [Pseudomonadota bacterium]
MHNTSSESKVTATIIPRSDHPLSRKLISENALKVLRRLYRHGYTAYLAGGGVRDILLGREPKDFDVVTSATPEEIKALFRNAFLIGRRFRIAHIRFKGEIIEVSTFRALRENDGSDVSQAAETEGVTDDEIESASEAEERKEKKPLEGREHSDEGMILRDNVWGKPEEDAFRRDFTVNALFYDIADFSIIDYVGGLEDLKEGRLRLIGEPEVRYREDPVRMLRAIRFAAKLGFNIDKESLDPMVVLKNDILNANSSRLYEELQKLWISEEAEQGYQLMRKTGLFQVLFPEVDQWLSNEDDNFPHTFLGRAFEWIEEELRSGRAISPALLYAIVLSGPINEKAVALQEKSGSRLPVIFKAVKDVVTDFQERISMPRRDVEVLKTILYGEQRFPQTRGKRPYVWARNPHFRDAFRYYKMKKNIEGNGDDIVAWWEKFLESEDVEKAPEKR